MGVKKKEKNYVKMHLKSHFDFNSNLKRIIFSQTLSNEKKSWSKEIKSNSVCIRTWESFLKNKTIQTAISRRERSSHQDHQTDVIIIHNLSRFKCFSKHQTKEGKKKNKFCNLFFWERHKKSYNKKSHHEARRDAQA